MSAKELLLRKVEAMSEDTAARTLVIIDSTNISRPNFPDTLEEYFKQKGWDGSKQETEPVDWGGFVGEEVDLLQAFSDAENMTNLSGPYKSGAEAIRAALEEDEADLRQAFSDAENMTNLLGPYKTVDEMFRAALEN
jgi:hypothetical protein